MNYEGSLTIDAKLMEAADLLPNERIDVLNLNNGERFTTYVIEGERGSGTVCVNGAAARLVQKGDKVIILSYALVNEGELHTHRTRIVFVNDRNEITDVRSKIGCLQASSFLASDVEVR